MSISGLFLILFLFLHLTINFFSVIDAIAGEYVVGNADGLFARGCEFMSLGFIKIMVPVLALGFVVHICYACVLTYGNIRSRGGYMRYAGGSKAVTESWAARNMFVLGLIVLGLLAFHLSHFWAKMQLREMFLGLEAEDPYLLLLNTFRHWWVVLIYVIWFGAICFHLSHGVWSAFQTIGWSNRIWEKRLKVIGYIIIAIIFLGFTTIAVTGFVESNFIQPETLRALGL